MKGIEKEEGGEGGEGGKIGINSFTSSGFTGRKVSVPRTDRQR